jgi:hypothetical protein
MRLRVATWNLRRRGEAWHFIDDQLDADIVLAQEAVAPPHREHVVYRRGGIGGNRPWGSAVAARLSVREVVRAKSGPMRSSTERIRAAWPSGGRSRGRTSDRRLSVSGLIDDGYAATTMHRILSDLTPLLDSRRERLVLGGDLNVSTQLERPYDRHSQSVFDRLQNFGLVDLLRQTAGRREALTACPCRDEPCTHVRTQTHPRSSVPWHNDYLFATRDLADQLVDCYALNEDATVWSISDHCPVVADFELKTASASEESPATA